MAEKTNVVLRMLAAWERMDSEELIDFFAEDAVWENMTLSKRRGVSAIQAALAHLGETAQGFRLEIANHAEHGDIVFTERMDRYEISGHRIALPVVGVFEVRDGKICSWRDYFDRETAGVNLLPAGSAAILSY